MRRIILFTNVSLDGYFEGPDHDISWANSDFEAFSLGGNDQVDAMLLGHRTYEMMKSFWPTPQAAEMAPGVARAMNETPKVVAGHHPFEPGWDNVTVISGDVAGEIRKLKEQPGKNIIMFGSNTLCVSLMQEGLVDEFQILVNPVAIGKGTPLFNGLPEKADLVLTDTHRFNSGVVMLKYEPASDRQAR